MNVEVIRRILVDAGPFIALFNRDDRDHVLAAYGFEELSSRRVRVLLPLPIAFEVCKWLRYKVSGDAAIMAIDRIRRGTEIIYPSADDFSRAIQVARQMPSWRGSLEDALLANLATAHRTPLWTLNYREFAAFGALHLWNPSA